MRRAAKKNGGRAVDASRVKTSVGDLDLVQRRRDQFVDAAVELFAEKGFYRTTVQQIADKAGMSAGLIYHYARTKEDVLLLALLSILQTYRAEIPKALEGLTDPLQRLWAAVDAYCRVVAGRRATAVLAYRSTKSLPRAQRDLIKREELETNTLIADCIRLCVKAGLVRKVNVPLVTHLFIMFAHSWALKYWRLKDELSLSQFVAEGFEIVFTGIATEEGRRRYELAPPGKPARRPRAPRRAAATR
jgi:AcrR family transcriptional regulator